MKQQQNGFTLIEISIVLVIIGLLTGAVLKGQQMIENSRYKAFVQEVDAIRAAVYTFQDRYNYLPGDYPNTNGQLKKNDGTPVAGGDGDGIVEYPSTPREITLAFEHLIRAGLISGDPDNAAHRPTPIGGDFDNLRTRSHGNGRMNLKLTVHNIPGEMAIRYDEEFDDGDASTGSVTERTSGTPAYNEAENVDLFIDI